jgi:Bax protein
MKYLLAAFVCFAICYLIGCDKDRTPGLQTEVVKIDSMNQIIPLTDSLVKPVVYTNVAQLEGFAHFDKPTFISLVLPSILIAKHEVYLNRKRIQRLREHKNWNHSDSIFYQALATRYKANGIEDLLQRLETLPASIALAQAAVETGWGKSRFFFEGNNLYGIWSMKKRDARMSASKTRNGNTIYVKTYADISGSVRDYLEILGRADAYKDLRTTLARTKDPFVLIPNLKYYSEQRSVYTRKLKRIILENDLTRYDHYQIDPSFIVAE